MTAERKGQAGVGLGHQEQLSEEIEQLRAERDELKRRLEGDGGKPRWDKRGRRVGAAVLAIVTSLLIVLTTTVVWTHRTIFNTDQWVATVAPIHRDPAVTAALSDRVTTQIFSAVDVEKLAQESLPPRAQFLAAPLANSVQGFIGDQVDKLLQSQRFQNLWARTSRFLHTQVVAVLKGDTKVLQTTNGDIVLNVLPVINNALQQVETRASGIFGRNVDIPPIKNGKIPASARQKISQALGLSLPADFGEIVLFKSDKLAVAQNAVAKFDSLTILLLVITPLLIIATLWLSPARRHTLIWIGLGTAALFVLERRALVKVQGRVVDVTKPENHDAARAIVDNLFAGLFTVTAAVLAAALVVVAIALVMGPYPWAVQLRAGTRTVATAVWQAGQTGMRDRRTVMWIRSHREVLQIAGAFVGLLLLLFLNVSWGLLLVIVLLVGLYEYAVYRI